MHIALNLMIILKNDQSFEVTDYSSFRNAIDGSERIFNISLFFICIFVQEALAPITQWKCKALPRSRSWLIKGLFPKIYCSKLWFFH